MRLFSRHTIDNAPEASRNPMTRLRDAAGVLPNLAATMAGAPVLIEGFVTLWETWKTASLDAREREILGLSNAVANRCEWCVAFHTFVAGKVGVDPATVTAIRNGQAPTEPRSRALNRFTTQLIERRGDVAGGELEAFLAAGFDKQQALEVVVGAGVSLMANYAGNFVGPELDGFLVEHRWRRADARA